MELQTMNEFDVEKEAEAFANAHGLSINTREMYLMPLLTRLRDEITLAERERCAKVNERYSVRELTKGADRAAELLMQAAAAILEDPSDD
jgi:hypothetical protein